MKSSEVLSLRVPTSLSVALDKLAAGTQRSRSFLIEQALNAYLQQHAWQVEEIEQAIREADAGDFASNSETQAVFSKYQK